MTTLGMVTLEADNNGLVTLQCRRCKSRFKVDCSFLNNGLQGDIWCPVCGISNSPSAFCPDEIIEKARKLVIAEMDKKIANAFKGAKITTNPIQRVDTFLQIKNSDYDMEIIRVDCCQKEIGLKPIDITSGFYCPYCGRIIK